VRAASLLALGLALITTLAGAQEPADPLKLVTQGRRLDSAGKQPDAIALYAQALAIAPDLFEAHLAMGIALDLEGRYTDAREHLTRAIALAPPEAKLTALNANAVSYAFERKADQGAKFYRQAYDLEAAERPASAAEEANALGRLYLESGDTKQARRWYETGYETARRQRDEPASQLDLWKFRWLHAQARIAARDGRRRNARTKLEEAQTLVAKSPALQDQATAVSYLVGYVELYAGDAHAALVALAGADQQDPFVVMLEARAAEKVGDHTKAQDFWRKVLTFNGHSLQNAFARPLAKHAVTIAGTRANP
jgi:tetratricopeptide (TPR) repeat protein